MAQRIDGDAGAEIKIFLARFSFQPRAVTTHKPQIGAVISWHNMAVASAHVSLLSASKNGIEKAAIQRRRLAEDEFYPKSGFFSKGLAF